MNLRNGDVKIIRTAGAIVSHPFGSIMRSIIVAIYELGAREVLVVGHHDCGMSGLSCGSILEKAKARGISDRTLQTNFDDLPIPYRAIATDIVTGRSMAR